MQHVKPVIPVKSVTRRSVVPVRSVTPVSLMWLRVRPASSAIAVKIMFQAVRLVKTVIAVISVSTVRTVIVVKFVMSVSGVMHNERNRYLG